MDDSTLTQGLEVGMSGMRLVTHHHTAAAEGDPHPERKETSSTVSTATAEDAIASSVLATGRSPNSHSESSSSIRRSSAPGSPASEKAKTAAAATSKPPGLTGAGTTITGLPSPIVQGHVKTSSATSTSPLLTLTPNSSIDGNAEWNRNSPAPSGTAPTMPFLGPKGLVEGGGTATGGGPTEVSSFGSFELPDHDNDGLLGLDALGAATTRAETRPYSASPPTSRGFPAEAKRAERPPLSQSAQAFEGSTGSYGGDNRSVGERSVGSAGGYNTSSSYANNVSVDSGDSTRGFGAIARPELRYPTTEYDPNRRRAFSTENFQTGGYGGSVPPGNMTYEHAPPQGQILHKFGSLPTLASHSHQHRVQSDAFGDMPRPRHIRSVSQPVQNPYAQPMDPRSYAPSYDSYGKQPGFGRSASLSQPGLSHSYEGGQQHHYGQKRTSLPGYSSAGTGGFGQFHSSLQRRDALDFQGNNTPHEDMRMYGGPNMISPGQSPMQMHYSSHSRHPSDAASGMLSSSPASHGSGVLRGGMMGSEDELSHPLIGENIDVPSDHFGSDPGHGGGYMLGHSASMPMMRPSGGQVHASSMDALPPYFESPTHLPTAGAGLLSPKVVYYVKFKRTQRNFVLGPRINRDLKIGTYVKVEADRGEDLGIVVGKIPADKYSFANRNQYTAGMGPPPGTGVADLKRIIRLATHDEVALLGMKREEEEELLGICRAKVHQRGLPMHVVDAEYQFDRHKLTFFFEAEGRVDFRELVRDLFSMYKTRIWMQQLDKNTSTSSPAIMAPQAANNLQMDYGTPIIAPASEFADSVVVNGMGDARSH
jgi:hypothetical protein